MFRESRPEASFKWRCINEKDRHHRAIQISEIQQLSANGNYTMFRVEEFMLVNFAPNPFSRLTPDVEIACGSFQSVMVTYGLALCGVAFQLACTPATGTAEHRAVTVTEGENLFGVHTRCWILYLIQ